MLQTTMTRGKIAIAMSITLAAFIAATACRGSYEASPLTDLTSTQQLTDKFDKDAGKVRVITLLSPV